jgi:uncharacterized protein YjbJ (UPF0337 family)
MLSKERTFGDWNSIVGAVKERFGEFTGDELSRVEGNVEQLVGLIQRKTGQAREQIEAFVEQCRKSGGSTVNKLSEKASEYASMAGDVVRENYDRIATEAERGYEYTARTVSRRPMESVAMALGVGLLAGFAIGLAMISKRR